MAITVTPEQKKRTESDLSNIAGEPVTFEKSPDGFFAFTQTELGALRIAYKYRQCFDARAEFSANMKCWFASIRTEWVEGLENTVRLKTR